jgi:hypothetical protein
MLRICLLLVLLAGSAGSLVASVPGTSAPVPQHRFDLAFSPLYYDYAEELTPPLKSTEYGWLPGVAAGYTYWGDAIPVYGALFFSYAGGDLTYDGSVQDQTGQVYPYVSTSPAGISNVHVRAGYIFKRVGGAALDLAVYTGYGYHFWSRNIAGGPPVGYLEEYSWSFIPLGVEGEWRLGSRWSVGLGIAARFMVAGEIMVERSDFGNPTLTLGNEPGWAAALPVSFSIAHSWAVILELGYESSAIGESNPSPPDVNGSYIMEPASHTDQFRISVGGRLQF